ncbi:hypothetical protein EDB83DRAFT_2482032 [Lactarius deliciosus]|nr:hypothetical protein EDB83DRAFT_2482032 [Lactarius deliciosus]
MHQSQVHIFLVVLIVPPPYHPAIACALIVSSPVPKGGIALEMRGASEFEGRRTEAWQGGKGQRRKDGGEWRMV